ncbi:MAG: hypothetical protein ACJ78R_05705, partial [Gemmatimonadaceae bacterium]
MPACSGDIHPAALSDCHFDTLRAQPPRKPVNLLRRAWREISSATRMKRYEVHERSAFSRELGELRCL